MNFLLYISGGGVKGRWWASIWNSFGGRVAAEELITDAVQRGFVEAYSTTDYGLFVKLTKKGRKMAERIKRRRIDFTGTGVEVDG